MKLRIYSYNIPFKKPFRVSGNSVENRAGVIFQLEDEDILHFSESAPLPGFSEEGFEDARFHAIQIEKWLPVLKEDAPPRFSAEIPASVKFAISSLWHKKKAAKNGKPLSDYLNPSSLQQVPVNAAIGLGEKIQVYEYAKIVIQDGYKTLKIKVGEDFEHEFEILKSLREFYPGVEIRIDANQSWDGDTALKNLRKLEPLNIQYCEQPVAADDIKTMAYLKANTKQLIAADESVRNFEQAQKIIDHDAADILVLKPTLIGSIEDYQEIILKAQNAGLDVVTTTTLESGIGRRIVAELSATVNTSRYANGLATGYMFEKDPAPDEHLIVNGAYQVYRIKSSPDFNMDDLLLIAES